MTPLVVIVAGVVTLGLRGAFLVGGRPRWERDAEPYLSRVPAAVLPALAASTLLAHSSEPGALARLVAAALALAVAWRTRSLLAALGLGMVALWLLRAAGV